MNRQDRQNALTAVQEVHALGLLDHQIAQHVGVSLNTVKRYRKLLGLVSNCPRNAAGKLAEQLTAAILRSQGLEVTVAPGHNPRFDLLVSGLRVDVKDGRARPKGAVQFDLRTKRPSNRRQYFYTKDYRRDTDFLALAVVVKGVLTHLYLLPSSLWKRSITVHPEVRQLLLRRLPVGRGGLHGLQPQGRVTLYGKAVRKATTNAGSRSALSSLCQTSGSVESASGWSGSSARSPPQRRPSGLRYSLMFKVMAA